MNKKPILIIATLFVCMSVWAQTGGVKAKIVSRAGGRIPIPAAEIVISQGEETVAKASSAEDGSFIVENLPDGDYIVTVNAGGFAENIVNNIKKPP